MKKIVSVKTITIVLVLLLVGCREIWDSHKTITGSGNTVQLEFDFNNFSKIETENVYHAEVTQGENYSILLIHDDNLVQYLDIHQSGSTIHFGLANGINYKNLTLDIYITLPTLTETDASGASSVELLGLTLEQSLDIECSGASSITGNLTADDVDMDISGASAATIEGHIHQLDLHVSGASHVDIESLTIQDAEIEISGASRADIRITGNLHGDVSGASHLRYWGNPENAAVTTSGASSATSMGD